MEENKIIFKINESASIVFDLPCKSTDLLRYDNVIVLYNEKNVSYVVYKDFAIIALESLSYMIDKALKGELRFHESIKKDIGYLWNKYIIKEKVKLTYKTAEDGTKYWVGEKYHFWSTSLTVVPRVVTWVYEKNNTFFLEITPSYQWWGMPLKDRKKDPNYITYKEFMQNYKPLVITTIARSTLEEWQKEVERLIPLIEANDSKYFCNENCKHD